MNASDKQFPLRYPLLGFLGGIAAFPVCFTTAAFFGGGRHDLKALTLAFPYAMMWGFGASGVAEMALMCLQFPVYGLAAGLALADKRFRWLVVALATAHLLADVWAVAVYFHPPEL